MDTILLGMDTERRPTPAGSGHPDSSPADPHPADPETAAIAAEHRGRGFPALRHRGFRWYFVGMFGRGAIIWLLFVAIPWYALQLGADPVQLGVVTALQSLPTLFIAPLGGVVADRWPRARVLVACQLMSALLAGGLWAATLAGVVTIPALMLAALLLGSITAVEIPVRQAYLSDLVPPELGSNAVGLHSTAWNSARFLGPALGGLLIATLGVAAAFAFAAVVALLVAWTFVLIERRPWHRRPRPAATAPVLEALREGAAYAVRDPLIRWVMVFVTTGGILGVQTFQTLAPLYATEVLGLQAGGYGALVALWGMGAVIAAYTIAWFSHGDRRPWLIAGGLGMAGVLSLMALTSVVPVALALAVLLGCFQIALVQNALVSIQQASPHALRGRLMGLYTTVFQGFSPLGAVLAGVSASVLGVTGAMLAASGVLAIVMGAGAVALRRARLSREA